MKKFLFLLVIAIVAGQTVSAQDKIKDIISELSKIENAQHMVIDKAMLDTQIKQATEADASGELKSKMPSFIQQVDSMEVLTVNNLSEDMLAKASDAVNNIKDTDGLETLLKVKQDGNNIHILIHKEGDLVSKIYITVIQKEGTVIVVMNGKFTQQDLEEIMKEQQKNM